MHVRVRKRERAQYFVCLCVFMCVGGGGQVKVNITACIG